MKGEEALEIETFFDLSDTAFADLYRGVEFPWEVLKRIPDLIEDRIRAGVRGDVARGAHLGERVQIGPGTVVEAGATIKGPAIIGRNCSIRSGAYIRSDVIIGDGTVVGNSSELKRSLVHEGAEIPHFSYVGDSLLGRGSHLGAGVKISNLKINREEVKVKIGDEAIETGLRKFGCIMGDGVEIGCNAVINPGTLIGRETLVTACCSLQGYYPPRSFLKLRQRIEVTDRRDS